MKGNLTYWGKYSSGMFYYECDDCGTSYPEFKEEHCRTFGVKDGPGIYCNGRKIGLCPYCKEKPPEAFIKAEKKLMKTTIKIGQEEIDHGVAGSPEKCPTALAFNKVLVQEYHVGVGVGSSNIYNKERKEVFSVPNSEELRVFIRKFDDSGKGAVSPMTFEVVIPEEYLKKTEVAESTEYSKMTKEELEKLKAEVEKEIKKRRVIDGVYRYDHDTSAYSVRVEGQWYFKNHKEDTKLILSPCQKQREKNAENGELIRIM